MLITSCFALAGWILAGGCELSSGQVASRWNRASAAPPRIAGVWWASGNHVTERAISVGSIQVKIVTDGEQYLPWYN
jgi:hypothetical protein